MPYEEKIELNRVVGVDTESGDIYAVDYVFKYEKALGLQNLQGATGTVMRLVSKAEYEEANEPENLKDYYEDIWRSAVSSGDERRGLSEWVADIVAHDGADVFDEDHPYADDVRRLIGVEEEDYPAVTVNGGGRSFHQETIDSMDAIFDREALEKIVQYEGLTMPASIDDRIVADEADREALRENLGAD